MGLKIFSINLFRTFIVRSKHFRSIIALYKMRASIYPYVPVVLYFGLLKTMRRVIREWMYYDIYATVTKCATIY